LSRLGLVLLSGRQEQSDAEIEGGWSL